MQSQTFFQRYQRPILVIASILAIFGMILLIRGTNSSERRQLVDSDAFSPDKATMFNQQELLKSFKRSEQYVALTKDLNTFARETMESYFNKPEVEVRFTVSGTKTEEGLIKATGTFDKEPDQEISIIVTPKNNQRIAVSITNNSTKASVDSKLPSNSIRNQFIGKLPVLVGDFDISFIPETDSFMVTGDLLDEQGLSTTLDYLEEQLQIQNYKEDKVDFTKLGGFES